MQLSRKLRKASAKLSHAMVTRNSFEGTKTSTLKGTSPHFYKVNGSGQSFCSVFLDRASFSLGSVELAARIAGRQGCRKSQDVWLAPAARATIPLSAVNGSAAGSVGLRECDTISMQSRQTTVRAGAGSEGDGGERRRWEWNATFAYGKRSKRPTRYTNPPISVTVLK